MPQLSLELLEISDEQVLAAYEDVLKRFGELSVSTPALHAQLLDNESPLQGGISEIRAALQPVLNEHGFLLKRINCNFNSGVPGQQWTGNLEFIRDASGMAKATFNMTGQIDQNGQAKIQFVIAVQKVFSSFHRRRIFTNMPAEIADFYTRRESTLTRLEDMTSRSIANIEDYRKNLDERFHAEIKRINAEYDERRNFLQHEGDRRSAELEEKERKLAKRETELEKADNTHARRKLRQDLKAALKATNEKFVVSDETTKKRSPVQYGFWALMAAALGAAIVFGILVFRETLSGPLFWFPSLRFALSISAFALSTVYYIRWADQWSQVHANEEFRLKRLDLDVDRASWLVEVLLEWRGETHDEIPAELIKTLSNGLFDATDAHSSATHPVEDAISTLLATPASLKLRLPGGELSLDKKSLDRAKAAAKNT